MKFLTNVFDPKHPDAKRYLSYRLNEDREAQWQYHLKWLNDKVIGLPEASDAYTVEQLVNMGYVGVYKR
jgi:hypothetical protein